MTSPGESTFSDEELLALLRDTTVSPEAIASEMQDAGDLPLAVEDLRLTREALAAPEAAEAGKVSALPARLRALVLEEALAKKAGGLVASLAGTGDKGLAKECKRILHLLKTQGVKVDAPKAAPAAPVVPSAPSPEEFPTFMTNVDGFGERVLLLARVARQGVDVAQVVVSDVNGVVDARLAPLARKEFRKFVQNLSQAGGVLVGEVPRSYARGLITRALDLNARVRRPVPSGWNDVAFALGTSVPPQPSPGRRLPVPEDLAGYAQRANELIKLDEFKTWMPAEDALRPLALKLDEIGVSPLYLDDVQREEATKSAIDTAVREYWTPERRRLVAERLFDLGWLLHGAGRGEHANLALASATWLDSDRALEGVSFCYALFEKLTPVLRNTGNRPPPPGGERVSPGGIILPG